MRCFSIIKTLASSKACPSRGNYLQNNNVSLYIWDMLLSHVPEDKPSLETIGIFTSYIKTFSQPRHWGPITENTSRKLSGEEAPLHIILKICSISNMNVSPRTSFSSTAWWFGRTLRSDTKPQLLEEQNKSLTSTGASHL